MAEVLRGIVDKARECLSDAWGLVACIIGAGTAGAVATVVKSWFPEQTKDIKDETLAAAVGFLLFYFGGRVHRLLASFGLGVFLAAVGAWTSQYTANLILMLQKK